MRVNTEYATIIDNEYPWVEGFDAAVYDSLFSKGFKFPEIDAGAELSLHNHANEVVSMEFSLDCRFAANLRAFINGYKAGEVALKGLQEGVHDV